MPDIVPKLRLIWRQTPVMTENFILEMGKAILWILKCLKP